MKEPIILVRSATKKGFEEAYIGDCIDMSYPKSKSRRGRVQKGLSQTITCNPNLYVVVKKKKIDN